MLFPPSTRAPPLSSIYALPFTHRTALLAPAYCNGVTRSEVISLCQLCLGLDLEDPTLTRLFTTDNLSDIPDGVAYSNGSSAATRFTTTSASHERRKGAHWSLKNLNIGPVQIFWNCNISSDTEKARGYHLPSHTANSNPVPLLAMKCQHKVSLIPAESHV